MKDVFHEIVASRGVKNATYYEALHHIQAQTRKEGIDAALNYVTANGELQELDSLILCDRLLVGQQIAAQAGKFAAIVFVSLLTVQAIQPSIYLLESTMQECQSQSHSSKLLGKRER